MSLVLIENANKAFDIGGLENGERVLLDFYTDDVKKYIHHFNFAPFSDRYALIQDTFSEHFNKQYRASIQNFLSIIDGVVNDYTKNKGFFASGTDLTAWYCLVGCSDNLTKIKKIINQSRQKTNSEEIRIPYRNGIMHGRDLNYANEYVSCKCVSLLFAVADWIKMKESEEERKIAYEKSITPIPLSETIKKYQQIQVDKEKISRWEKREIIVGKTISQNPTIEECSNFPYIIPILNMFDKWRKKNYGELLNLLKSMFKYYDKKQKIIECKNIFKNKELCDYKLIEIEERGCSLSRILVEATWKTGNELYTSPLEFGCAYLDDDFKTLFPWDESGNWTLIPWNVQGL